MGEHSLIAETPEPRTRLSLAQDLRKLGLSSGMTVIVHTSLSSLGWVCGGPVAVVQALMDVVTPSGTIVMPTQTSHYSDPSQWMNPPVPKEWWEDIRRTMPAYEPDITPSVGMGAVAETFRSFPGVMRSAHPALSFAAWGKHREDIILHHALDDGLGEQSPLARLYDLNGSVLLLGVGHDSNTSFHLAEYRARVRKKVTTGAPVLENGQRIWKTYEDIELNEEEFEQIGRAFEEQNRITIGQIGSATAKLFNQRNAVDFAQQWLTERYSKNGAV